MFICIYIYIYIYIANIHVKSHSNPALRPFLCARSLLAPSLAPFKISSSHMCDRA